MRRKTTIIVVFFVFFTAAANLVESTGLATAMGVSANISAGEQFAQSVGAFQQVRAGSGIVDTLIGIYTGVTSGFMVFVLAITAGPRLLLNAGVPGEFVAFLFAPAVVWIGTDVVYYLSGREA